MIQIKTPSLLALTAAAAAVAAIANGIAAATPAAPEQSRLGAAIGSDLGARDQAAVRRDRALDLREQAAKATEARMKEALGAQQAPAAQPGQKPADQNDQFSDLARIYQAMKPAAAALVFEQLDMEVQLKVAQRMRERSTAMILAAMTPKGAAALSMALARRPASRPMGGSASGR
jgi:flagellar motility protein MotE (MotC chaperone)